MRCRKCQREILSEQGRSAVVCPSCVVASFDLSLFNRKFEHGCLDIECRSCAERTDDPVLARVREVFGEAATTSRISNWRPGAIERAGDP